MMTTMVAGSGGYYLDNTTGGPIPGHPLEVLPPMCTPPQHSSPVTTTTTNSTITTSTCNNNNTTTHVANLAVVPTNTPMDLYTQGPPPPYGTQDYYGGVGDYFSGEYCHTICALQTVGPTGPATVRMVSTNTSPPIPLPVQVPPGHVVQQLVDENGTLQHVILSTQPIHPMPVYHCPPNGQGPPTFYGPPPPTGPPPQSFIPSYQPTSYPPVMSPPLTQPSPPPSNYPQKIDRQTPNRSKFDPPRPKFYPRQQHSTIDGQNKSSANSSLHSSPPLSPQKENLNTNNGVINDSECHTTNEDSLVLDPSQVKRILSKLKTPEVIDITARSAVAQWYPIELEESEKVLEGRLHEIEYEVFLNDGKFGETDVTSVQLNDLLPGKAYKIFLICKLAGIRGEPSPNEKFTTLPDRPESLPPVRILERTKSSLSCKWTQGKTNGSRILNYLLQILEEGKDEWYEVFKGRSKHFTITKLTPLTTYRIRIAAVNEVGQSDWSIETVSTTTGTAPSRPSPPSLEKATVSTLTLTWERMQSEEFILQMENTNNDYGYMNAYYGADVRFTCTELDRNTEYRFRISAKNKNGTSPNSDLVSYWTLPDRPKAPSAPTVKGKPRPTKLVLTWNSPSDNGGSPVLGYKVEMEKGNEFVCVYDGPNTECECIELNPGTSYTVRALASSKGGDSDWSASAKVATEPICPRECRPPQLVNKPKASTLQLKWEPPENDGGSPITEYHLDMTSPDNERRQVYCGRETQCTVASLLPGRHYIFLVRANNKVGLGNWSEPLEVVSGAGPPDLPHAPHLACRGPHTVQVSWDEPINNGAGIETFSIQMAEVSNPSVESSETSSSCGDLEPDLTFYSAYSGPAANKSVEISKLLPATTYAFRVNATNSAGPGQWSAPTQVTTPAAAPSPVSHITSTSTATSVSLRWIEPSCNGDPILNYIVEISDGQNLTTSGPELEYTVDDLNPETVYKFRIQAVNSVGTSGLSSVHKVSTRPLPPSPPTLELVKASYNSLRIKWGDGRNPDMLKYCLQMESSYGVNKTMEFFQVYSGTNQNFKISKLNEMTWYRFKICASNEAGTGPFSEIFNFYTSKAHPPPLKAPRVTEGPESTFSVEWCGVRSPSEDQIHYKLQVQKAAKDQEYSVVYYGMETSYILSDLEANCGYYVRVCGVRVCSDGDEMAGAYSSPTLFNTPQVSSVKCDDTATAIKKDESSLWNSLGDQGKASIISLFFFLLALLFAWGYQFCRSL